MEYNQTASDKQKEKHYFSTKNFIKRTRISISYSSLYIFFDIFLAEMLVDLEQHCLMGF